MVSDIPHGPSICRPDASGRAEILRARRAPNVAQAVL